MGKGKLKAIDVGGQIDIVCVRMFIDEDTSVISGYNHIAQDRQCSVVASWGYQTTGAMGRFGGLNIVDACIDENMFYFALRRVLQIDAADTRIIIGSDIQIPENHVDPGELKVKLLR